MELFMDSKAVNFLMFASRFVKAKMAAKLKWSGNTAATRPQPMSLTNK